MTPTNEAFETLMPEPHGYVPFPGEFYPAAQLDAEVRNDPLVPRVYSADQMRQMFDAATERAAKLSWQPIETAPKDGTMFLCWVGAERWSAVDGGGSGCAHDVSQIDFCWWRRVHESPDGGYFDNASGQIGDSQGVTHWMPLPGAPVAPAPASLGSSGLGETA